MSHISKHDETNIITSKVNIVIIRIHHFHAVICEYHQFLFQFWKGICLSSRNVSDNLVRDGFRPQFYYRNKIEDETTEGTYPFIEKDFVVPTRFNT